MSIRQCLKDRFDERQVFEIEPLIPRARVRSVWATREVFDQLSPETANEDFALHAGRLRRKLETIVIGDKLIVGDRRDKTCDLKRLDPQKDEVWEIRERDSPSIRLFFRFIEADCLATTNLRLVSHLFEVLWMRSGREFWPTWNREIKRCKAIWRQLFLTYPPHSKEHLNEYLSNATGSGAF